MPYPNQFHLVKTISVLSSNDFVIVFKEYERRAKKPENARKKSTTKKQKLSDIKLEIKFYSTLDS